MDLTETPTVLLIVLADARLEEVAEVPEGR